MDQVPRCQGIGRECGRSNFVERSSFPLRNEAHQSRTGTVQTAPARTKLGNFQPLAPCGNRPSPPYRRDVPASLLATQFVPGRQSPGVEWRANPHRGGPRHAERPVSGFGGVLPAAFKTKRRMRCEAGPHNSASRHGRALYLPWQQILAGNETYGTLAIWKLNCHQFWVSNELFRAENGFSRGKWRLDHEN
jgi:hypothetical protein